MKIRLNNKLRQILGLAALLLMTAAPKIAMAHFIWIEPATTSVGKNQKIEVYFGEYNENNRETQDTRLNERKGVTLNFQLPEEKPTNIPLTQKRDHYVGRLSLKKAGVVELIAQDLESAVVDYTKYGIGVVRPTFYARTRLAVFNENEDVNKTIDPKPVTELDTIPLRLKADSGERNFAPRTNENFAFQVFYKSKPLSVKPDTANVYAPNGWMQELPLDDKGMGKFKPLWPGLYIIDIIVKEKVPGNFKGVAYEAIRHRSTLSLTVEK